MSDQRERQRRELKGQGDGAQWAKRAEESGGGGTAVKLPDGVTWWKAEPGESKIDFMPFIATPANGETDDGWTTPVFKFHVHNIPGPDGKTRKYCCLWENWKEPCPVCKRIGSGRLNTAQVKKLKTQVRRLWLLNAKPGKTPGTKDNPWRVFDSNQFNQGRGFGQMMAAEINAREKYKGYFLLEGGYTATLRIQKTSVEGSPYNEVIRIDFDARDYDYPKDLVYDAPVLDECLNHMTYEDLELILDGGLASSPDAPPAADHDDNRRRGNDDDRDTRRREDEAPRAGSRDTEAAPRRRVADDDEAPRSRTGEEAAVRGPRARDDDPPPRRTTAEDDAPKRRTAKEDDAPRAGSASSKHKFEVGNVVYRNGEECEILRLSDDDTAVLEGADGKVAKAVPLSELVPFGQHAKNGRAASAPKAEAEEKPTTRSRDRDDDVLPDEEVAPRRRRTA